MLIPRDICEQLADDEMVALSLKNMDYFNCIVLKYSDRLERYIKRISGASDQEVEDVLQDAFVNIWKNLNEYRSGLKLSSWLYRIVHNVTISRWRKSKTHQKAMTEGVSDIIKVNYEESEIVEPQEELVQELIQQLDPKYRDVVILKYFEAMNYEEISDVLKIPEGTVAIRLNRGKKALKVLLEKRT